MIVGEREALYICVQMNLMHRVRSRALEPKCWCLDSSGCVALGKVHHNHLLGLLKFIASPVHGVSHSVGLGGRLAMLISNKCPGDVHAAGPEPRFENC